MLRHFSCHNTRHGGAWRWIAVAALSASCFVPSLVAATSYAPTAAATLRGPTPEIDGCAGPSDFGRTYLGAVWPGGFHAVPVYSNGISGSFTDCLHSTRTPKGHWVVDGYEWQCVELVDRLYLAKGWIGSTWLGNGDQMFYTAPRSLRRQRQGAITRVAPGDVISFNGPAADPDGHAAVIARVRGRFLTIVNQDTGAGAVLSHAWLRRRRIEMVGWAGWSPIGVVDRPS